jgi:hypothetical protein
LDNRLATPENRRRDLRVTAARTGNVTVESHLTYVNLTGAFFKQMLFLCCETNLRFAEWVNGGDQIR